LTFPSLPPPPAFLMFDWCSGALLSIDSRRRRN
jgi:hypothetical protein